MLLRSKKGRYGYVQLHNPPVNAIGREMRAALLDAVEWAESENLERVILSGEGHGFAAGADASEFDYAPEPPHLPDVLTRIEKSAVHWIAAIHGVALGGGAEIALACRYRVARPDAQIGFPEVILGVVPGAGGTQRLPRLVGVKAALSLIPTGKSMRGSDALNIRLVDALSEDPVSYAEMINSEWLDMAVPSGELNTGEAREEDFEEARKFASRKMPGQSAPAVAIDLLALASTTDLEEGMLEERRTFLHLREGTEAKALRHLFFAERGAKKPKTITAKPMDVATVAVVGGGTMGAGIAYAMLNAGLHVVLLETDPDAVERASSSIGNLLASSQKRGLISDQERQGMWSRLSATTDYAAASKAELAIEAVFESMDVKREVFKKLEAVVPRDAVLATNTSYLDVNEIAAGLDDPTRLIGLHFFAPAYIMKLLEIVRGDRTSDTALATGYALAKSLRKIPVVSGVCDGFIGNRILARYREAADTILMDGSNPWEIDEAMEDFGYAMGPYAAQDLSGLDIAHANRRRQDLTRNPLRRYIPIADRMVNEGRLGRKTSVGWYRYPGGNGKVIDPLVEDLVREEARFAGVARCEIAGEEVQRRLLLAMINEAANILWEGIAEKASDIDLVTVHGYGFPRNRGGLMHYADTLGVRKILEELSTLAAEDKIAWEPSPLFSELATTNTSIVDWRSEMPAANSTLMRSRRG
jgi:3-hydroxyacyl-CoA dehydrogenase